MSESYKFTYIGGTGEIIEKKSRFIATVEPVKTEEEALAFIERIRKQYWAASHTGLPAAAMTVSPPERPGVLCWTCFSAKLCMIRP